MNNKILYKPQGLWHEYDFMINKYFWIKAGYDKAYEIRENNIKDVRVILESNNIKNFLFGQTLKGIFITGDILDDHDDDFGVFFEDRNKIRNKISKELIEAGFSIIRDTEDIISFERDFRYIDICLFKKRGNNQLGYGHKWCSSHHFYFFDTIGWKETEFSIPNDSNELLSKLYLKPFKNNFLRNSIKFLKKLKKLKKIRKYIANKIPSLFHRTPLGLMGLLQKMTPLVGVEIVELTKDEFLNTYVEPLDSFNWKWRARHLDVVTNKGKNVLVKDIVNYLLDENVMKSIDDTIEETDTSIEFFDPSNFDMRFWWGGNNYFFYCIKYQFRKNVIPYSNANAYIKTKQKPNLYSANYYEALEKMTDVEIRDFLSKNPIEIENSAVVGGKHRVFAMIGRMIAGKEYIPMRSILY